MENNVYPFSDTILDQNDIILFDTSYVLNLCNSNNNTSISQECDDLTLKIIQSRATSAISLITYEELYNVLLKQEFSNHFNGEFYENDIKVWKNSQPKSFQSAIENALLRRDEYINILRKSPAFYPEPIGEMSVSTTNQAIELQRKYVLPGLNDARQIAIANNEGISCFATTDSDFLHVNEAGLKILVDSNTYNKL